jgi:hypothetical protein
MELSARPDVSPLDRLATPPVGAHELPMSELRGLNLGHTTTNSRTMGR